MRQPPRLPPAHSVGKGTMRMFIKERSNKQTIGQSREQAFYWLHIQRRCYFRGAKLISSGRSGMYQAIKPLNSERFKTKSFFSPNQFSLQMKNLLFAALAFAVFLVSLGCPKPAPLPVKFASIAFSHLRLDKTAESEAVQGFTINFDKVSADSRCPMGVECITAGKADIVLILTKAGETQTLTLPFTITNGTSNVTDFKGHTVRVMGVAPMKYKDKEIKPDEYVITLSVIETPPPVPMVKLGEDFTLGVGERIGLAGEPANFIRFDSVVGDSRCPEGVAVYLGWPCGLRILPDQRRSNATSHTRFWRLGKRRPRRNQIWRLHFENRSL